MALPSPTESDGWTKWKNLHKITTPTFDLTPVEKPDFSPFLIHMTGKNSLVSILKGENAPEDIEINENEGYLKSVIPDFEGKSFYNSEVVCFTESPIFALDFFRYRSFRRFRDNQQFGIGFSKSDLIIKRGVRPVVYFDSKTNREILKLCNQIIEGTLFITDSEGEEIDRVGTFEKIKPLLFPLLEDNDGQGFMWEREWRYPDNNGLVFSHDDIEVICCPKNERAEIEEVLGDLLDEIEIVESWKEYDEVTKYLKRREKETDTTALQKINEIESIAALLQLKSQNEQTLNVLAGYYTIFKETADSLEERNISQMLADLERKSKEIDEQIKKVVEERKAKEEQAKNNDDDDEKEDFPW